MLGVAVTYELTAGGSTVVETLFGGRITRCSPPTASTAATWS